VDLELHNRELSSEDDLRALAREIESCLLRRLLKGGRLWIL
jgi:hypothetical protein